MNIRYRLKDQERQTDIGLKEGRLTDRTSPEQTGHSSFFSYSMMSVVSERPSHIRSFPHRTCPHPVIYLMTSSASREPIIPAVAPMIGKGAGFSISVSDSVSDPVSDPVSD